MESQGSQLKHEREKQIYEKRAELDKLNQEKHAKQAIKDEAETHEKAALDVIREEEEKQRAVKEECPPEVQALVDAANIARDEFVTAERACNDIDHDVQVIHN